MNRTLFFVLLVLFSVSAHAQVEIWQCTDKRGHTYEASQDVTSDSCKQIGGPPKAKKPRTTPKLLTEQKHGVRIGMTKDEVISSSWGRPNQINRTQNAYGTHEQWVYGGRNYLYFVNDILTTIQN